MEVHRDGSPRSPISEVGTEGVLVRGLCEEYETTNESLEGRVLKIVSLSGRRRL